MVADGLAPSRLVSSGYQNSRFQVRSSNGRESLESVLSGCSWSRLIREWNLVFRYKTSGKIVIEGGRVAGKQEQSGRMLAIVIPSVRANKWAGNN